MSTTQLTGQQQAAVTFSVDSFSNGIAFGQQKLEVGMDARDYLSLGLNDDQELGRLRSRYLLHTEREQGVNPLHKLEQHLIRLSRQGILGRSQIYFGSSTDPFHPFDGKFDASMRFLELFKRYTPGLLVIQTRSPLLVIAMPVLRKMGRHVAVTIGIETPLDEVAQRYTPSLPRISERLKTARALRNFGIEVTLQVAPMLPYGDWRKDAPTFADLLIQNSDYIYVRPFADGSPGMERRLKANRIAQALARERKFHWLRPDAANPLITSIEVLAPNKLKMPEREQLKEAQIDLFSQKLG
jgi:hypothetical protein